MITLAPSREAALYQVSAASSQYSANLEQDEATTFSIYPFSRERSRPLLQEVRSASTGLPNVLLDRVRPMWEHPPWNTFVEYTMEFGTAQERHLGRNPLEIQVRTLLDDVYEQAAEDQIAPALRLLFGSIEKALAEHEFALVDSILEALEPTRAGTTITIGVLRATFRVRARIKSWNPCLIGVWKMLDDENQDTTRLLRGLVGANGVRAFTSKEAIF